ncbi:MAG: FimB/Mfa2 family fimbrial subunit [bacterium]|nr:FimB/Mfa2 family fimbrial subunit [bacterium]
MAAVLVLPALCSCIRDDRGDCEFPLRLHFTYLYNREATDLLRAEVSSLHLALYHTDGGRLAAQTSLAVADLDADNNLEWLVPEGRYTLVAWGGLGNHYVVSSPHSLSSTQVSHADGAVVSRHDEHLWHRAITDVTVTGNLTSTLEVDLHKLSNDLTVSVVIDDSGLSSDAAVTAANATYTSLGTIHPDAPTTTYRPRSESGTHHFTLGTLAPDDDSILRLTLAPASRSADDAVSEIFNGSLSALLAADPDVDLDLDDDFRLEFRVNTTGSNAAVSAYVNGWHIVDYDVTLR